MRQLNYPSVNECNSFFKVKILNSNLIKLHEINQFLIDFGISKSFEELILLPIEELILIQPINDNDIKLKYSLADDELKDKKAKIRSFFNYKELQKNILSSFFMKYSSEMNLKTCPYCNIEYVNTFINFQNEYFDKFDLINNVGDVNELKLIKGIDKSADEIFKFKGKITNEAEFIKSFNTKIKNILNNLFEESGIVSDKLNTSNHFTIDHLLPQSEFIHLSLSLYNLIPSCYSCNSKFKKDKKIYELIEELKYSSPTSKDFDSEFIETKILYNNCIKLENCESINDYKIKIVSKSKKYTELLKLQGRYNFHKDISFDMIKMRKKYSDKEIQDISNIIGKDVKSIKIDLFGKEIFEDCNSSFEKYKKDIAKQLGLIK
jgi:hypothetical protein